jgi:hypothetical protein
MVTAIGGVVYPNRTPQNQRPSQQQRPPEHRPSHLILISLSSGIYHHHDISLSTQASAYARRQCHPQDQGREGKGGGWGGGEFTLSSSGEGGVYICMGYLSIAFWLCAQLPQVFKNASLQSCEGLALPFLVNWLFGDFRYTRSRYIPFDQHHHVPRRHRAKHPQREHQDVTATHQTTN